MIEGKPITIQSRPEQVQQFFDDLYEAGWRECKQVRPNVVRHVRFDNDIKEIVYTSFGSN